jgi:hypothetical protein
MRVILSAGVVRETDDSVVEGPRALCTWSGVSGSSTRAPQNWQECLYASTSVSAGEGIPRLQDNNAGLT